MKNFVCVSVSGNNVHIHIIPAVPSVINTDICRVWSNMFPAVSLLYLCLRDELTAGCVLHYPQGGPGSPSKQTPTWDGAKQRGNKAPVSPRSECFVRDEAPAMAPGSWPHVTRLKMRDALVSWTLTPFTCTAYSDSGPYSDWDGIPNKFCTCTAATGIFLSAC